MSAAEYVRGADGVCFDAGPLIQYADAAALAQLNSWFSHGTCFTADVVTRRELPSGLRTYPQNQDIIDAPWLVSVAVEDNDLKVVTTLRALWGSEKGRDHGEAEVIALCLHYGWTAVMNDGGGRHAATKYGVPCVSTASLLVGATAAHAITADDAWALHKQLEGGFDYPMILPVDDVYRPAFDRTVRAVERSTDQHDTSWPATLAMNPRIDDILRRAVATERSGKRR